MNFTFCTKIISQTLLACLFLFAQDCSSRNNDQEISQTLNLRARINPKDFDLPMHLPALLSGNFGELRYNHFHSGLDFKTQGSIGRLVYAVADGWVSRIRISSYGFGYALYIDHPNGFTTVYGHLSGYAFPIDSFAKKMQYGNEEFELDTMIKRGRIPVKRGQLIAYSGNSGGSVAPHLHFEIRDTKTEETIDPLLWFSGRIKDNVAPRFQMIALYPVKGEGILNSGIQKATVSTVKLSNGTWALNGKLPTAWGKIGFGLKAYDFMSQTSNNYGVSLIRLFQENEEIFRQDLSHFSFAQTRYINALTDYEAWLKNDVYIMKSFLEPGNRLKVYPLAKNEGYININEEKIYHFRYELEDRAGNISEIHFDIQGEKRAIPKVPASNNPMNLWYPNHFIRKDIELFIPAGTLYNNIDFQYSQEPATKGYSDIYKLHNIYTPLHQAIQVQIRIQKDILSNKKSYYLAKQDKYGHYQYAGGAYSKGMILANIREFGNYIVLADSISPKITGLNLENSIKNHIFRIRIIDNLSGIQSWRGTIDGSWVLFEYDYKTATLKYKFDDHLKKGKKHILLLLVKDACENESCFEYQFYY